MILELILLSAQYSAISSMQQVQQVTAISTQTQTSSEKEVTPTKTKTQQRLDKATAQEKALLETHRAFTPGTEEYVKFLALERSTLPVLENEVKQENGWDSSVKHNRSTGKWTKHTKVAGGQ